MSDEWKKDNTIIYIFWFDQTLSQAESFLNKINETPTLLTTRESSASLLKGKTIVFAEHFPLQQKEKDLYHKLNLEKVQVWSALDEPIFQLFGGEKIVQMMKKLGMKETEAIEHTMLNKAINSALQKIEKKVMFEQTAQSQKDWFEKNLIH